MGDPLGAVGSIVGIAAFGLQIATMLQMYIEAVFEAQESLKDIALDVSATASALEQLDEFIKPDQNNKAIASKSGVEQVKRLASQCEQVYGAIIHLIAKAVGVPKDNSGKVTHDALNLHSLNAPSRIQKLIWPFRESRIKRHQEDLRWLKISLLFHLRLMELAKTKMTAPARSPDAYEKEVALQAALEKLLSEREAYAKLIAAQRRGSKKGKTRRRSLVESTSSIDLHRRTSSKSEQHFVKVPEPSHAGPSSRARDGMGIKSTSAAAATSSKATDDKPEFVSPERLPEPPQVTSRSPNNPVSPPITDDTPNKRAEFHGSLLIEGNNNLDNDIGHPKRTEPFRQLVVQDTLDANPAAPQTQTNTQTNARSSPKSLDLEAYLVENDFRTFRKIPFGHEELADELSRLTKSTGGGVWTQYASLNPAQRESVDRVAAEANRSSHRSRTCVAISRQPQGRESCIVAFFSLGPPVQPVHVKYGEQYFQFAFELCRKWEDMGDLLEETVPDMRGRNHRCRSDLYHLKGLDNHVIPRAMWSATVCPGLVVFLVIYLPSSMPTSPKPQFPLSLRDAREDSPSVDYRSGVASPRAIRVIGVDISAIIDLEDQMTIPPAAESVEGSSCTPRSISSDMRLRRERESFSRWARQIGVGYDSWPGNERNGEEDSEEDDIIDFEEEQMHGGLGLGAQLGMWTNVFSSAENNENDESGS
ncbi:hypothetical protein F5Y00DRAFT_267773 [Daldinia vernicosa]|uniref:uncharacterized protein n=1 Tax=Daldinia vernicosa TaxID=114800 RepID=UPI0020089803|nr:uncharacterized protein F5Y00DRAFT_267773 [Daldinia vernicosa]KAI0851620.1 hypothetical protein F5Y00DRAFT_267773 [Daldinia vernicosa]